jgi:hypothetical protein
MKLRDNIRKLNQLAASKTLVPFSAIPLDFAEDFRHFMLGNTCRKNTAGEICVYYSDFMSWHEKINITGFDKPVLIDVRK